jgi:hypothetical protein
MNAWRYVCLLCRAGRASSLAPTAVISNEYSKVDPVRRTRTSRINEWHGPVERVFRCVCVCVYGVCDMGIGCVMRGEWGEGRADRRSALIAASQMLCNSRRALRCYVRG